MRAGGLCNFAIPPADAALLRIEEYVAVQPLKAVTGEWLCKQWVKQQQQPPRSSCSSCAGSLRVP